MFTSKQTDSEPKTNLTADEVDAIRDLIPGRAEEERERERQAELDNWRRLRVSTYERIRKDQTDLRELTDRLDREKAEAIDKFWRDRA